MNDKYLVALETLVTKGTWKAMSHERRAIGYTHKATEMLLPAAAVEEFNKATGYDFPETHGLRVSRDKKQISVVSLDQNYYPMCVFPDVTIQKDA